VSATPDQPGDPAASVDPLTVIKSKEYLRALVLAALIALPVAVVAYGFLALVDWLQEALFTDLPSGLGFDSPPVWWPVPLLAISGLLVALCIRSLPGNCGHSPSGGFQQGPPTLPIELPGIALAALATLAFGAVLGPEAPLIAIGSGLGALAIRSIQRDSAPTAVALIATAGSFAAISTLIGSPIVAAFLMLEVAGIGGTMLAVALLPGLLAAGLGFLVFVGLDSLTGQGTFSLAIPDLPAFTTPTGAMFGWALVLGFLCPLIGWLVYTVALSVRTLVHRRRLLVTPLLGVGIAALAILFGETTDQGSEYVLFSGQAQLPVLVEQSAAWSTGALLLVIVCKGLAYAVSLSAFRGGPIFPSLFIGGAIGVVAADLPGMSLVPGLAIGIGAMCVSMLRLPFTSVLLATVLLSSDAYAVMPLAIVAVVVAYVATERLPAPRSWFNGLSADAGLPSGSPSPG
jgi:chloride channel protein, CIC family